MDDDYVFFYRDELKKIHTNPKTYLRAIDDLINHGFIRVIGYMYTNKFKPTLCIIPTNVWRNWIGNISTDEFIKKYIPPENTRQGNKNTSIRPSKQNKIIDLTKQYNK